MSASTVSATQTTTLSRRKIRALGVAGAVAAALVVWVLATVLGMEVLAPGFGGQPAHPVGPGNVLFSASVASLAGWGLLAALDRLTRHARVVWTATAAIVFLFSLGGPMSGDELTGGNRAVLALMHVAVAAVLVPVMRGTALPRS